MVEVQGYSGVYRLSQREKIAALIVLGRVAPMDTKSMVPDPFSQEPAAGETKLDLKRTAMYVIVTGSEGDSKFDWERFPLLEADTRSLEVVEWMILWLRTLRKKPGGAVAGRVLALELSSDEEHVRFSEELSREMGKVL